MQSQDGVPIPAEQCDFTFRAESGMCKKANIDALRVPPVTDVPDVPHTIYTQKVQEGVYPNDNFFGSKSKGPNAFAKNTDYSKPITDYTKDPTYVE
jgi:hypothetical protein